MKLVAHVVDGHRIDARPAPVERDWMDDPSARHAYRCLPLMIANQSGWIVRSPIAFSVRWNGGNWVDDVTVKLPRGRRDARICSHFGEGVVTLILPYLFRTPRGINPTSPAGSSHRCSGPSNRLAPPVCTNNSGVG